MTGIRITVSDRDLRRALAGLAGLGRNPAPFFLSIGQQIITSTRDRADKGISPAGIPWTPLARSTQLRKRGTKMLREEGEMLGSFTREVRGNTLAIGTNTLYAAIHQFGGQAGRKRAVRIPARPFLGISADDVRMIREEWEDFARRATGAR